MSEPARRGRPRHPETDERILTAAADLLRENGPTGVTFEAVASRSGVARTTIYRRFDTRRELVAAVTGRLVDRPLPPAELPLEGKVRWTLDQITKLFEEGLGRGALAALIADTDPDFTASLSASLARRLEDLRAQVQGDVDDGLVAAGVDPAAVVSLLVGAHLGEVLRTGGLHRGWDAGVIQLITRALQPD
ncbi:TetR/AcrR family transcriptional regulator [Phycicoccus sp. SLBN-51]|uniref:TetR/AcrR family transcriptional regulator n=1 Tax=Phycicoccus sp. SLBN-51 TaxID=2768447 RepID=UPI0011527D58|nr:TetR/AcrR family transcriptional regulator [Phycicoccus sp. SLBN-51]TQJ51853.1 TetR family transcriptional regulator [Phycicoccus sp. SLBN-51]